MSDSRSSETTIEEIVEVLAGGWDLVYTGYVEIVRCEGDHKHHRVMESHLTLERALISAFKHPRGGDISVPAAQKDDTLKQRVIEILGRPLDGLRCVWSTSSRDKPWMSPP